MAENKPDTYVIVIARQYSETITIGTWTDEADAILTMNNDHAITALVEEDCLECYVLRVEDISGFHEEVDGS